jgi:hypothetical protein
MSLVMGGKMKGKVIFYPKICVVSPFFEISSIGYIKAMKGFLNITFEVISLTKIKVVLIQTLSLQT